MKKRPSHHELCGKLKMASEAAVKGLIRLVEPLPILADLTELETLPEDLPEVIPNILLEIGPQHYKGRKPPEESYEAAIRGCELYAFKWESKQFGCTIYFKFALKDGALWIVSLHVDRSRRREGT